MKKLPRVFGALLIAALCLPLVGCEGLTLATNPDGSISGSYRPPVATQLLAAPTHPVITPSK